MAIETTILDAGDAEAARRWYALWKRSPQRTVFSRLEYIRSVAEAADLEVSVVLLGPKGKERAAAALTWRQRGPYREIIVPPVTPFSGVLFDADVAENEVHGRTSPFESLLNVLEKEFHLTQIHLPPSIQDVRPASWRGWDVKPLYTYVSSLPTESDECSGSAARNFRKAGDEFELVVGAESAAAAARLCAASYARHGRRTPLAESRLKQLVDGAASTDLASGYGVRSRATGEIEAAVAVARSSGSAHYWVAGSEPGPSMTVLIGELLTRLGEDGIETFDFVGANTPSIAEFKRKFGCTLQTYYRIVYVGRPELKLLKHIRSILR